MKRQFATFLLRWVVNSFGFFAAVGLFGSFGADFEPVSLGTYVLAGLVFSLVNTVLKPLIIILSLPAILLTLGLFVVVVNGFLVYLSLILVPGLSMSFGQSVLAGILLSLINYTVTNVLDTKKPLKRKV